MYEKFYGFKENPFTITPDPKFFFPSPKHTEVLDSLIYTVTERRGFAVITGEIGSGKTTICRTLLERLNPGTKVAMITNTYLSPKELLSYTLEELGVTFDGREKSNLLSCLKKFLVEQLYLDFNVVLIIDEAQNLSLNVLEEIRMLSNLETEKKKMIQIILTGQPALKDKLASKELEQLRQRINVQYHIPPLNRINNERYINHRLEVASINGNRKVEFTPEAIDKIYAHSQGIPRVINMVCNNALLIGYVTEATQITPQIIKEAIEEFQNEIKVDKPIASLPKETESRLTQLNEQLNSNQQELITKQSQVQATETQLNQKNSELKTTETQLKQLNEQLNSNQEKLATTQSQLQEAGTKLTQLNEQLNRLKKDKEEAQLQQAKLEQLWLERQTQWQVKEDEASNQLQSTHDTLNKCESSLQEKTLELKELIRKIDLVKEELGNLQEQKHKSQEELLAKLESTRVELDRCQSDIAKKQSELGRINKELQSRQENLNITQSLIGKKEAQLQEQNQKLAAKESQFQEAETKLTQLNEQLNQLQKDEEGASRQLQATESKLSQLNEELKKAQEENSQLKLKQGTVSSQLKASLNLYESAIAGKQVELDRINKNLQSNQEALNTTQSSLSQREAELEARQSQLQATETQLKQKDSELETTETQLKQLNEQLNRLKKDKEEAQLQQAKLEQLWLERQTQWQTKEEEASKQLQSTHTALNNSKSSLDEKTLELKELIKRIGLSKEEMLYGEEQIKNLVKELLNKQLQVNKAELGLKQLNEELKKLQEENNQLQLKQERISSQLRASREELKLSESGVLQKQTELKGLIDNINQIKKELREVKEQKNRHQQAQEKLNKVWSEHQLQWHQKEKEILEEFKFTPISKTAEGEALKQPELEQVANIPDNSEKKLFSLEKSDKSSIDKPIIKLKPKKPKTNAAILAASHLRGEIKIDPIGNDDFLSSFYSGIRIFHRNGDIGNYKNFIFSAKGDKKRDYSTVFRVELNNNGSMKVGKHHSVRVTDSWQKFNIPLEDFSRMINLNIITEIAIFLDDITEADDITYIKDICFSNI